jgi:hypothetical protein
MTVAGSIICPSGGSFDELDTGVAANLGCAGGMLGGGHGNGYAKFNFAAKLLS